MAIDSLADESRYQRIYDKAYAALCELQQSVSPIPSLPHRPSPLTAQASARGKSAKRTRRPARLFAKYSPLHPRGAGPRPAH